MDLTSLALLASLLLGLIVSDRAVSGGNMQLTISVPAKVAETGFTEQTAEDVFIAEAARVGRTSSLVHPPVVETSAQPGLLGAFAKPLNLEPVALALRTTLGLDTTTVAISVITASPPPALNLIATITLPGNSHVKLAFNQPDGDATALIERSAREVLARAVPYRVALADLTAAVEGGDKAGFDRAKQTALTSLARPFEPALASQWVMLHNILAMLALIDGNRAEAERQFALSEPIPGVLPAAHATIAINRAFLAVADREPAKARAYLQEARQGSKDVDVPAFHANLDLVGGLVEWSAGHLDRAESILRDVVQRLPADDEAHTSLGRLLIQRGKTAEGEKELRIGAAVSRYDHDIGPLAHTFFYVDPAKGGLLTRD